MKRRNFIIAAATMPLLTQLQAFAKESQETMGFVVVVVNVGLLPPHKAEAFVERMKETFKKQKERKPAGWTFVFFPTREWDSNIEIYTVHPDADRTIEQIEEFIYSTDGFNYDSYLEEYNAHHVTTEALSVAETMIENLSDERNEVRQLNVEIVKVNKELLDENEELKRQLEKMYTYRELGIVPHGVLFP